MEDAEELKISLRNMSQPDHSSKENSLYLNSSTSSIFDQIENDDLSDCTAIVSEVQTDENSSILDENSSILDVIPREDNLSQYLSESKLNIFKQLLTEVNERLFGLFVSECLLNKYKTCSSKLTQPNNFEQLLATAKAEPLSRMRNRRGEMTRLLGLKENDFDIVCNNPSLNTVRTEFNNTVLKELKLTVEKLLKEKENLKDAFGSHYLNVVPLDSTICVERVQQAMLSNQLGLQLHNDREMMISANQLVDQISRQQDDSMRVQQVSHSLLQDKARYLCNSLQILRHKMDKIVLADTSHTRSMNSRGNSLQTSLVSLREKRKRLLQSLEKYERKAQSSSRFNEIVSEYAKTKKQLQHRLQMLHVLNDPLSSIM